MGLLNKLLKKKKDLEKDSAVSKKESKTDKKSDNVKVNKEKDTKKTATKRIGKKLSIDSMAIDILLQPLETEKSANAESINQYSFVVDRKCNKDQIKKAIFDIYGIMPRRVATANFQGKKVRFKRFLGKRQDYKKAIVTLPKGKSIDIHKGV